MYERFTDRSRKVMQLANQEAMRFNHKYIGTEHILLGLLKEGTGVASNVLKNLGMDLEQMRTAVENVVQAGPDRVTMGKLPMTPSAKRVMEHAIEEARTLNHNYVGTEHLLLGLLREQERNVALDVFKDLGLTVQDVRAEVVNMLGHTMTMKDKSEEEKSNEVIAEHMQVWTREIAMARVRDALLEGLCKEFMTQTGLTADKVNLYIRSKGDTTYFGFCKADSDPAPVPEPGWTPGPPGMWTGPATAPETAGCRCKSLIHGHEPGCAMG